MGEAEHRYRRVASTLMSRDSAERFLNADPDIIPLAAPAFAKFACDTATRRVQAIRLQPYRCHIDPWGVEADAQSLQSDLHSHHLVVFSPESKDSRLTATLPHRSATALPRQVRRAPRPTSGEGIAVVESATFTAVGLFACQAIGRSR